MATQYERIVAAFAAGKGSRQDVWLLRGRDSGPRIFSGEMLGCHTLFSYGTHFPLAIWRDAADNAATGEPWVLLNGDRYSMSTSRHQALTFDSFRDHPRVSFACIERAISSHAPFQSIVVAWTTDLRAHTYRGEEGFDDFESRMGMGTTIRVERDENGDAVRKSAHRIGAVVLRDRHDHDRYFLCAMDEGSYFVSRLPRAVTSVEDAFLSLRPQVVQDAEARGITVRRQGEWFFLPCDPETDGVAVPAKSKLRALTLPSLDGQTNRHVCGRGFTVDDRHIVKGLVRHRDADTGRASGEHRALDLGDAWHWAIRNTSLGDWTASSRGMPRGQHGQRWGVD